MQMRPFTEIRVHVLPVTCLAITVALRPGLAH